MWSTIGLQWNWMQITQTKACNSAITRIYVYAESWEGSRGGIKSMMYYICKVAQSCNRISEAEFARECNRLGYTKLSNPPSTIAWNRVIAKIDGSFLLTYLDVPPDVGYFFPPLPPLSLEIKHDRGGSAGAV